MAPRAPGRALRRMAALALERLAGPTGPGAARAAWDSAFAELRGGELGADGEASGSFSLWLWRFYEAVEREETRVTLTGVYQVRQARAVSMAGFQRRGLNQTFAEEPGQRVAGLPTWWSEDGRYFIYFAEEYAHWKVNALRSAGGDGLAAVLPGARRAGRGFAHSGAVDRHGDSPEAAWAALCDADAWFELAEGDWEPVRPQLVRGQAVAMSFTSDTLQAESMVAVGEESTRERREGGSVVFRGIRHAAQAAQQPLVLFLPPDLEGGVEADSMPAPGVAFQPAAGVPARAAPWQDATEPLDVLVLHQDHSWAQPEQHQQSKL